MFRHGDLRVFIVLVGKRFKDRHKKNFYIEKKRNMVYIPNVQFDPFIPFYRFSAVYLGPSGDAGADLKHPELFFGIFRQGPGMVGEGRSGPD